MAKRGTIQKGDLSMVRSVALDMLVAVEILNRLFQAEVSQNLHARLVENLARRKARRRGLPVAPRENFDHERIELAVCSGIHDVLNALLEPRDIARLDHDFTQAQVALWEEEVVRFAKSVRRYSESRGLARAQRAKAEKMLAAGDAAGVKRTKTYKKIADAFGIKGEHCERRVHRLLRENVKARGGVRDIDPRLFEPKDATNASAKSDEFRSKIVRKNGRKKGSKRRRKRTRKRSKRIRVFGQKPHSE